MSKDKKDLVAESIFRGYCKSEIIDFDSLPPHIQLIVKKSFYAGMITVFNVSDPVFESLIIGKNADILREGNEAKQRFIIKECKSEIEAKKMAGDFSIYQEARTKYEILLDENRDYAKSAMTASQKDSPRRQAEKKSESNVFDFNHPAPKTTQ